MNIKQLEELINLEICNIVIEIINNNKLLNISAKSRAGAEISNFLENEFINNLSSHKYLFNAFKSPSGATKNPWDVKVDFKYNNHIEEIWIDFKAIKLDQLDSNPDIGTPTKFIKFVKNGGFYLLYIFLFYREQEEGLEFCKLNNSYLKSYFLKDVHRSFRRNPKNQLQVSASALPIYRTREEFINLLFEKLKESYNRQIKIAEKELLTLESRQSEIKQLNIIKEKTLLDIKKE